MLSLSSGCRHRLPYDLEYVSAKTMLAASKVGLETPLPMCKKTQVFGAQGWVGQGSVWLEMTLSKAVDLIS